MPLIKITDGQAILTDDPWHHLDRDEAPANPYGFIVPLDRGLAAIHAMLNDPKPLGLRLESDDELDAITPILGRLSLIALTFAKFTDGRAYSQARLLRERFGFRGELRAVGHVLPDQLFYMTRCGFDAFELEPTKDPKTALRCLHDFSVRYQPAADEQQPLWRRVVRPGS